MGLKGRLEAEVELRSSGDLFHEMFVTKPHDVSKASPQHVRGFELHGDEACKTGSVVSWHYNIDGKECVDKNRIETLDKVNKTVTYKLIEGDLLNDYKDFIVTVKVTSKPGGLDLVKWTLEFETIHEDTPYPTYILDTQLNVTRDIENHHLQA